ncbi:AraC family transcriptional regulator [Flavobacteriaceae bacterium]|nr:AraC family transcriptional regulator [Flavobacteriaceae bacterium]MDB4172915.1 AraC family transcriptional regulator [Flavobacteriaceae bacterium]
MNLPEMQRFKKSKTTLENQLKLESGMQWAAAALLDPKFNANTIDAIGNMAGYQSKSAFYKAFKEHHGITPQEYQQNNK